MTARPPAVAIALATCAGLLMSASTPVSGQPAQLSASKPPVLAGCRIFPANNYWNTPVSSLPRDPRSRQWLSHMSPLSRLHPDFGPSYRAQRVPYGIPVTVVGAGHRRVHVAFGYASESDRVRYPLGADTRIEGGQMRTGDRHAVIVDKGRCRLYETFATTKRHGHWRAGSGATWSLKSNALRHQGWTSADAAGLPILPGLLRYREVEVAGRVTHAVRFTTDVTDRRHIWPARHDAGSVSNHAYPPMGARFRLKASFDIGHYRKDTQVVLRAMKRYGLVLADNGSPWFFQGDANGRWPSGLLDQLKRIPARAFVAVDTRSMRIQPNSGAAHQP
ncbi:MAG: hypothetical protein ABJA81_06650 [Nocardioidaceae bacterium]